VGKQILSADNTAPAAPAALASLLNPQSLAVERIRILLADDHTEFLQELRALLDGQYEIAATVFDGKALTEAVELLQPDLVICDISMPVMTGFEAASRMRSLGLKTKLIFLTIHTSPAYVRRALKLGAQGYISKLRTIEQLMPAISRVLDGGTFISPELQPTR